MTARQAFDLAINWDESARPKYKTLTQHLVEAIRSGRLRPGSALPTEKSLARDLGIARSTVRQAMGALEREGLIRRVQGRGTFVMHAAGERIDKTTGLLALVVPETRAGFYPSLLHGFEAAAREHQCQAIICNTDNNIDKQGNAILQLIDKKVAGVTMVPASSPSTPPYQIRQLREHGIGVVYCHRPVDGVPAPLLALPYEEMGRLAGQHLTSRGHRRVAFFAAQHGETATLYRRGLEAALRDKRATLRPEHVWHASTCAATAPGAQGTLAAALDTLLAQKRRPTAIFASFDSLAEAIHLHLAKRRVRVPEEMALIGVGGAYRENAFERELTSVVIDEETAARRAVELLAEMIHGTRDPCVRVQIDLPATIFSGQTVASPEATCQ
jgi:DNA-binding LacI/PurR family transcriptional regulator